MKYILSISLLLCSLFCSGQVDKSSSALYYKIWLSTDGTKYYVKNKNIIDSFPATLYRDSNNVWYAEIYHEAKNDTIKIIYQYSDTVKVLRLDDNKEVYFHNHAVKWAYGYKVIEQRKNTYDIIFEEIYLDENKTRLYKNIVVWQDIEID